jgi:release factor glutamine methyltransferase
LAAAGCVAADEEAEELVTAFPDANHLDQAINRRITGEPLAWITGQTIFCGVRVVITPRVYVPRWQSESLTRRAAELLPDNGHALDFCTGSGAIAKVLQRLHPHAHVVGTEIDPEAASCGRTNGVTVYEGDLDSALPDRLHHRFDLITAVAPYVPTESLHLLPRDVLAFETNMSLDGGAGGLGLVRRVIDASKRWIAPAGWLLLEVGCDQIDITCALLEANAYGHIEVLYDGDGDPRGIAAQTRSSMVRPESI